MQRATVLIIDPSGGGNIKERLARQTEFRIVGSATSAEIGFTMAERYQPAVIVLNVDMPGNKGTSLAETLSMELPMSSLVLATASDSKRVLHLALQVGAKDVVTLPIEDDRLVRAVQKAAEQAQRRQQMFSVEKKVRPQFKTITVFSTKGGVGKTTVALNLALAVRAATGKRVVAVDLDLLSGNLGLMAGIVWKRSIKDLVDDVGNVDQESLDAYCAEHPSGLRVLPAPAQPDFAGFVQAEHIQKVVSLLSQVFNYVIIDAPTYLHDTVLPALEESQEIVVVTTLDLASIQNMKQSLDLLSRLSMRSKVRVVVNRVGYTGGLKVKDLEDELGMPVQCVLPSDEKLSVDAVNMGTPVFVSARGSALAKRIEEFAMKVLSEDDRGRHGAPLKLPDPRGDSDAPQGAGLLPGMPGSDQAGYPLGYQTGLQGGR